MSAVRRRHFDARVSRGEPDQCWPWMGSVNQWGYGRLGRLYAHRLAWEYANERSVPPGALVLHACDNPPCCNPAHLRLGSAADNASDAVSRGRTPRNTARNHRLSESHVRGILDLLASGSPRAEVAAAYGISLRHVQRIEAGVAWGWVK